MQRSLLATFPVRPGRIGKYLGDGRRFRRREPPWGNRDRDQQWHWSKGSCHHISIGTVYDPSPTYRQLYGDGLGQGLQHRHSIKLCADRGTKCDDQLRATPRRSDRNDHDPSQRGRTRNRNPRHGPDSVSAGDCRPRCVRFCDPELPSWFSDCSTGAVSLLGESVPRLKRVTRNIHTRPLYSAVGQAPIFRIIMKSDFVPYQALFPRTPERLGLGLYKCFMGASGWFKNGYENILRLRS
jgi:hypothetical protein